MLGYAIWNSDSGVIYVHIGNKVEAEKLMAKSQAKFKKLFPHSADIVDFLVYEVPVVFGKKTVVPKFFCREK